jgi:hypothetical protein
MPSLKLTESAGEQALKDFDSYFICVSRLNLFFNICPNIPKGQWLLGRILNETTFDSVAHIFGISFMLIYVLDNASTRGLRDAGFTQPIVALTAYALREEQESAEHLALQPICRSL